MLRRSFLILHGIENHRPPDHWQSWLAVRLRERGHQVSYPALPDPDAPLLPTWIASLRSLLGSMHAAERVVICHSLACMLWFHAAAELHGDEYVDRLLLVSPPASECIPPGGTTFRLTSIDAAAVLASARGEVTIVCSDCDPYNPTGAHALYGDPLQRGVIVLAGAGHITPEDGYGAWPSLARWCDDPRRAITGNDNGQDHLDVA